MKPFAYTNAMNDAIHKAAGVPTPYDFNPWREKINIADYDAMPSLTRDKPAGYPLQYPTFASNTTNVKMGHPPFSIIEEPTKTDVPSEAMVITHNKEDEDDMDVPKGGSGYQPPKPVMNDQPSEAFKVVRNQQDIKSIFNI